MKFLLIIVIGLFPLVAWAQPTISAFNPSSGSEGTTVIISGSDFSETPEDNTVTFDGIAATVTAASLTSLTTTVPAGLTAGPITVEITVGGQTAPYGFIVLPTITNFTPASGVEGTLVTISGTGFSTTPLDNEVTFNGVTAIVTASTSTSITTSIPGAVTAGSGPITVTVGGQLATSTSNFTVLPAISSVTPISGVVGTNVTITGTGLSSTAANNIVTINGMAATVTAASTTSITTSVPAGATSGIGSITVTVGGQLVTSGSSFTITPTIASFSPSSGVVGASVTISGTGFSSTAGNNIVTINGVVATVTAASTTSITTSVPAGATAGTGTITIAVGGQLVTSGSSFTITPTIAGFSPSSGVVSTSITITGTGFSSTAGNNIVTINGVVATVTAASTTSITTSVPAGATAGTGTITVTVGGQLVTSGSNFTIAPTITGFTPTSAATGASITVTGTGFSSIPANNTVRFFNNILATVTAATTTSLTVSVPTNASAGTISVTVGGQTATSSGSFTPLAPPTITSLNPNSGAIGGSIAIIGTNFSATASDNVVQFNGTPAVVNNSNPNNKRLTVTVPAGATTGPVTLSLNGVTVSSPSNFTVLPTPSITSFSPTSGAIGATVTITGENFTTITAIAFNGILALADIVSSTPTSITVKVPSGAASGPISVTTSAVTLTTVNNFTVLASPTISGFTPGVGAQGTSVNITGTNFSTTPSENSVSFNGTQASVLSSSSTTITTTVPAGASSGPISLTVSGVTISSASNFTVLSTPGISGFSPTSGAIGSTVIIAGTNFDLSPSVSFNGIVANVVASTTNSITVVVPENALTGPISVTSSGITIASASNFTVLPSPAITGFNPISAAIGATIIISGNNFSTTPSDHIVKFNNTTAVVSASTANSITTTVPSGATTGKIAVTVSGVTVFSADDFIVLPSPILTGFNPTSGALGATVVIEGNNFSTTPSSNLVKFNGVTALVSASSTSSITTTVPVGAGTGNISVTTNAVTVTSGSSFTVLPSPTLSSVSPASGAVGATITITGTNFSNSALVSFNGTPAVVTASTATSITTIIPAGATSGMIEVTTSGVTITSISSFTVLPTPTITDFSPGSGAVGASVVISGTNFSTTPSDHVVKFNSTTAVVTASTATSITTTVPVGANSGKISVDVSGVTLLSNSNFNVLSTPSVTGFTPSSASVGAVVVISGTNFDTTSTVWFNGIPSSVTSSNTGSITTTVPVGASNGPISISVNGVTIISSSNFSVLSSPALTGFTPNRGAVGTVVNISGSNFITSPSISFNGKSASITSATSSSIETSVPSGATTGPISIIVNGVAVTSGDPFTVLPTPTLNDFSPANAAIGATVIISGNNFDSAPDVFFNGVAATVTSSSANSITAIVPSGATSGKIVVMTSGITVTSANNFIVLATPTISGFSPTSGAIGATVIITGTNFNSTPSNNSVTFNGVSAVVSASSTTSITTSVPAGASSGPIAVTVSGVTITSVTNFIVLNTPTITGFSPGNGALGASVLISGTNFSNTPADHVVKFNNTIAVVTASTTTTITAIVPAGATSGKISVTVSGVTILSNTNFEVSPTPTLTGFSPTGGVSGTIVTITGTNFNSPTVTFNNIPAVVTSSNSTSITTSVPTGAGTGPISVTTSGVIVNSATNFTVFGTPSITGFTPSSGVYGVSVTISGSNFSSTVANNTVRFNGVLATVSSSTTTSITTSVPVGATTGPISVAVNGITGNSATNFTVPTPVISSFSPSSGVVGTSITLSGTNFSLTPGNNLVEFNGINAIVTSSTSTSLVAVVPLGASTGTISVTVGGVRGTSPSDFIVLPTPAISGFSPSGGAVGAVVILSGTNFSSTPADHIVKFNNTNAVVTASTPTSITTVVPAGATTGKISISVSGLNLISTDNFTVFPTPTITGFNPAAAAPGALVVISGTNFSTTSADHVVKFNNVEATVIESTATSITAAIPAGATSGPITIKLRGVTITSTSNFSVLASPTIIGFNPTSGAIGADVIISGTNFSNSATDQVVKFNNTAAVVTGSTSTSIITTVPAGASTGPISVTINGATVTSSSNFTVLPTPSITGFSPTSGAVDAIITITGSDFSPTPSNNIVRFNGVTALVTEATATTITTRVPAGATTGKIALTLNGVSVQSANTFTVLPSPTITGFNLSGGAPGATVIISGTNFNTTPSSNVVTYNGVAANVISSTGNTLTTLVPQGASTGPITVTVNGVTITSTSNFVVLGSPSITTIAPASGSAGATVTISGLNFNTTPVVKFNNTLAVASAFTTTSITTSVPIGATTGKISITANGVTVLSADDFNVLPRPAITGFNPKNGAPGATVVISGTNFNSSPANNLVYFNGALAVVIAATNSSLTTTVPANAVTGPISVNTSGVMINSAENFEVLPVPSVIDINPEKGAIGATVTITGTNFNSTPEANVITFNGIPSTVTASSSTSITTTVPPGATTGKIYLTLNGITINSSNDFVVMPTPIITEVSPLSGAVGATVTITGLNFSTLISDHIVKFNGVTALVTSSSSTSITTKVPAGASTGKISVTLNGVSTISSSDFTIVPPPTITNVSPTSGTVGTVVKITGLHFSSEEANNLVTFNGTPAAVDASGPTVITTTVPEGATSGLISVSVNGASAFSPSAFNVLSTPTITSFDPARGVAGTTVTILGNHFSETPFENTVKFNGTAGIVTASTSTSIITTVPANASSGPISVSVNGLTGISSSEFMIIFDETPPVLSLNKTLNEVPSGSNLLISAQFLDPESDVIGVSVTFQSITNRTESLTASLTKAGDDWEFSVPSVLIGELGIEYKLHATNGKGLVYTSPSYIPVKVRLIDNGLTIPYNTYGSSLANYAIISVPLVLDKPSVQHVLDELPAYDKTKWRISHYENTTNSNKEVLTSEEIEPGKGYWLLIKDNPGVSLTTGPGSTVDATSPFKLQLKAGWNQIGNPYNFNIPWSDLVAANPGLPVSLRSFNGSIKNFENKTTLNRMEGGFVNVTADMPLVYPVKKNSNGRIDFSEGKLENSIDQTDWDLDFIITQGDISNVIGGIGMRQQASEDFDIYDGFSMPRFDEFLEINHNKKLNRYNYSKDVIATTDYHTWQFKVEASNTDKPASIQWENRYMGTNDYHLVLYDEQSKVWMDMKEHNSYRFTPPANFKVIFGSENRISREIGLGSAKLVEITPNPTQGPVNIHVFIPDWQAKFPVQIDLKSLTGITVANLFTGELMSGYQKIKWSGESGIDKLPAGVYIVQLKCNNTVQTSRVILLN